DDIRNAIGTGAFFLACFSKSYAQRTDTYMNEELAVAVEELRLRRRSRAWFLPISLDGSPLPDLQLGSNETLLDGQSIRLDTSWEDGVGRLVRVIAPSSTTFGPVRDGPALQEALKSIASSGGAATLFDDFVKIERTIDLSDDTLDDLGEALLSLPVDRAVLEVLSWKKLRRLPRSVARLTTLGPALLPALDASTANYYGPGEPVDSLALASASAELLQAFAAFSLDGFDRLMARYQAGRDAKHGYPHRIHPSLLLYALGLVARAVGHRAKSDPLLDVG